MIDEFSFKDVAIGALTAGVTQGLSSAGVGAKAAAGLGLAEKGLAAATINAALSSAIVQGVSVATGLQEKFSWRDVAISAAAAPARSSVGGTIANKFASGFASTLAGAAVRASLGGKVDTVSVVADAFGNALANSLVARGRRSSSQGTDEQAAVNEISAASPLVPAELSGPRSRPTDGIEEIIVTPPTSGAVYVNWGEIFSGDRASQRQSFERASAGLRDAGAYDALGALHGAQLGYRRGLDALEQQQRIADYIAAGEAIYARSDRGAPRIVDEAALIGRERGPHMTLSDFGRGVGNALFQVVYQPLAMAYDLEQVAWEAGRSLITGEAPRNIYYASALGEAASGGAGTGEILLGGLKGAIETPGRLIDAVHAGDGFGAGNELTNLAMMVYGGKVPKLANAAGDLGSAALQRVSTGAADALAAGRRALGEIMTPPVGLQAQVGAVGNLRSAAALSIAPPLGRFRSMDQFAGEVFARYQRYTNEGYARALRLEAQGGLKIPKGVPRETVLGQHTDNFARIRTRRWLRSEGIAEGPGQLIQVNRRLRDPAGSGSYRVPDIGIGVGGSHSILDGTLGWKIQSTPQIADFYRFSGSSRITIVRPQDLGGSYSLVP